MKSNSFWKELRNQKLILRKKKVRLIVPRGQVFFTGYHLLDLSLNQQHLHIFSYDTDSHSLCDTFKIQQK